MQLNCGRIDLKTEWPANKAVEWNLKERMLEYRHAEQPLPECEYVEINLEESIGE